MRIHPNTDDLKFNLTHYRAPSSLRQDSDQKIENGGGAFFFLSDARSEERHAGA